MALRSFDLTSVANVKTYLGISVSTYNSLFELLIGQATDTIERYLGGRRIVQTAYTNEEYDGTGSKHLLLLNFPVSSTATFTLQRNRASDNTDDWETIDAEDYWVDYDAGIVHSGTMGDFLAGHFNYRVSYTAGYQKTATNWTMDLEGVCILLVGMVFNRRKAMGISSESIGDFSVDFTMELERDPAVKATLDKYKRWRV